MPRLDGTGPLGEGPFTGKGMGFCAKKLDEDINKNNSKKEESIMPRGDGTGPMGFGSMTGRRMGYCAGYPAPGYMNFTGGRGYFGRGRGFFGRGGGRGRRNWYYATGLPGWARAYPAGVNPAANPSIPDYPAEVTPKQELDALKGQAQFLKEELDNIQNRIESLEKIKTEEDNK